MESSFWKRPFILASIAIAKSKKNFPVVTEREYDLVIVDEAHHLKNRNTLNWKLVNALKKRFLLLLTATPVENNLMELYNLVTLLKPGQLKTTSNFRNEFMTRGDPTDPRNRSRLRELLGQVMVRNTRALARVDIPPRFARTIKVAPRQSELDLYERISTLAIEITATNGRGHRLLLKNLLEEAGSSPRAVSLTLARILENGSLLLQHENEVTIYNLCAAGSIEDYILQMLDKKINMFEMVIGEIDMFYNISGKVQSSAEIKTDYLLLSCRYTAQSDEQKEGLISLVFNYETGALIPRMARMLSTVDKSFKASPKVVWNEGKITNLLNQVKTRSKEIIMEELAPFRESMIRRFKRDARNLEDYFYATEREMRSSLERQGLSEELIRDRKEKIALLPHELERKKDDLFKKYSIKTKIEPCAVMLIRTSAVKILYKLSKAAKQCYL